MAELSKWEKVFVTDINWRLLWFVNTILSTFWLGMAALIPEPYFKPIAIVVSAIQGCFLVALRGEKYLKNRELEPPKDLLT